MHVTRAPASGTLDRRSRSVQCSVPKVTLTTYVSASKRLESTFAEPPHGDLMNTAFDARLTTELDVLRAAGTYKRLRHLTGPMAAEVHMEEAGDVIVLSSNNYLGLADHPGVVRAGIEGLQKYGAGTASVRFICGTFTPHLELEQDL